MKVRKSLLGRAMMQIQTSEGRENIFELVESPISLNKGWLCSESQEVGGT